MGAEAIHRHSGPAEVKALQPLWQPSASAGGFSFACDSRKIDGMEGEHMQGIRHFIEQWRERNAAAQEAARQRAGWTTKTLGEAFAFGYITSDEYTREMHRRSVEQAARTRRGMAPQAE